MDPWRLVYEKFDPENAALQEALCVLGNGYLASRGVGSEARADGVHYPGTYLAGGYDRAETELENHIVKNEDLVNWPNWLPLTFKCEGGNWFDLESYNVISYRKEVVLSKGELRRTLEVEDSSQRRTLLEERRLVSMDDKHIGAVQIKLTPVNWSGEMEVLAMLDGSVQNRGVARYKKLASDHLEFINTEILKENTVYLEVKTKQSQIVMGMAARTDIFDEDGSICSVKRDSFAKDKKIGQRIKLKCEKFKPVFAQKVVTFFTSKDFAISDPKSAAGKLSERAGAFEALAAKHSLKWKELWFHFDLELKGMPKESLALRLHVFHLLQTASHNTIDVDSSVPARGLHGEAYRGHIFWDEMFIFPFYYFRMPELARSLLMYRYRRLDEARELAKNQGYSGAMYPWQSGSDGSEESQKTHLNPKSGRWVEDKTHLQRHINGSIVYNIIKYYEATDDHEFMYQYGAEVIFEICKFWESAVRLCSRSSRYEIWNVVGPDEFHTSYPGSLSPGLKNNAYTNYLASWSFKKALEVYDLLNETRKAHLLEDLNLDTDDLAQWEKVSRNMLIPCQKGGIISQFSGYESLKDFDWKNYKNRYEDLARLDRILEAENKDVNEYKVNKQADVLMLFYLFSAEELEEHFKWMDLAFDPENIPKNIHYYLEQSSHGSTLSRVVHSWVLARTDRARSWKLFQEALESDLMDIQGGTTGEGIHLGAMAGTVDLVQRCFTGMEIRHDVLWFNPRLPEELKGIDFRMRYRSHWLRIRVNHSCLRIEIERSWVEGGKIGFKGKARRFQQGDRFEFPLHEPSTQSATQSSTRKDAVPRLQ